MGRTERKPTVIFRLRPPLWLIAVVGFILAEVMGRLDEKVSAPLLKIIFTGVGITGFLFLLDAVVSGIRNLVGWIRK